MKMSAFDRWLTTEPPFDPIEVSGQHDEAKLERRIKGWRAPEFDNGSCSKCGETIGGFLAQSRVDPWRDVYKFYTYWIMDEDMEVLWCENCLVEWEEEAAPCECGGDHDGGTETCVLKEEA